MFNVKHIHTRDTWSAFFAGSFMSELNPIISLMFPSDNSDDVDPSAAMSKDGQPAAPESGQFIS